MTQMPDAYYRISTKALIYNAEGKILLCKESDGRYDLPGGGLDHGESPVDGLKRELMEEMGLELLTIDPRPKYFFTANRVTSTSHPWVGNVCYEVTVKHLNFTPTPECVEIGFFSPEEMLSLHLFENVEVFARMVGKNLTN